MSSHQRAFTLVEVMLALGVITIIGSAVIAFQISVLRGSASMQAGLIAQQQARKTLEMFTKEVRAAEQSPAGYPILEVGTSTFTFYSNVDSDIAIERVRYYVGTRTVASTSILYKEVVDPVGSSYPHANSVVSQLITDIRFSTSTPVFNYYNADFAGTSSPLAQPVTPSAIRLVSISLPVDPNSARSPVFQTYTTHVSVRNVKDNL